MKNGRLNIRGCRMRMSLANYANYSLTKKTEELVPTSSSN